MHGFLIWNQLFECVKITVVVYGCNLECKDNHCDFFLDLLPHFFIYK